MSEESVIKITGQDIVEANRLSHSCPICASAVEKNLDTPSLAPVVCAKCQTLYHRVCWDQNGGRCATLGCAHDRCYEYGTGLGPLVKVRYSDLPEHVPGPGFSPNGRFRRLKAKEKEAGGVGGTFWERVVYRLFRAIGWR